MENKLEDIGFYTLTDERVKNTSLTSQMQRCEMIITEYCNFGFFILIYRNKKSWNF